MSQRTWDVVSVGSAMTQECTRFCARTDRKTSSFEKAPGVLYDLEDLDGITAYTVWPKVLLDQA
jgi:hypothetical protein